jgi:hypothetical protein
MTPGGKKGGGGKEFVGSNKNDTMEEWKKARKKAWQKTRQKAGRST